MNKEQNVESLNVSPAIAKPMLPAVLPCPFCGFTDNRALNIDHIIPGNGLKERTEKVWRYLKDLNRMSIEILNKDYQCLCANCHAIKSYNEKYKSINTSKITKKENKGI